jgi:hypothetical protein
MIKGLVGARAVLWLAIAVVAMSGCTPRSDTPRLAAKASAGSPTPSEPEPATEPSGSRLVETLRSGGHVIYIRHAATDSVPDDADTVDFSDCDTQRNLSDQGSQAVEGHRSRNQKTRHFRWTSSRQPVLPRAPDRSARVRECDNRAETGKPGDGRG